MAREGVLWWMRLAEMPARMYRRHVSAAPSGPAAKAAEEAYAS